MALCSLLAAGGWRTLERTRQKVHWARRQVRESNGLAQKPTVKSSRKPLINKLSLDRFHIAQNLLFSGNSLGEPPVTGSELFRPEFVA